MRAALSIFALAGVSALPAIAAPGLALADDDGYCDHVQGVASAESAILVAPEIFGQFGRVEQPSSSTLPAADPGGLRFIGGLRWKLSGIYEGVATRGRADADCRRHRAFDQVRSETLYRALEARAKVIEGALPEAEKLLAQSTADLEARRSTVQDATATRLRVEELRRLAMETRAAMRALPAPGSGDPAGALSAFQRADDDIERHDAKLRRARAVDLGLRVGVDQFLDRSAADTSSPYFAVVSLGVNLGLLWQGSGNARAAAGRRKLVRSGRDAISASSTAALIETTAQRAADTAALEADLARQVETLSRVGGDDSKRYRQIVWFDWIKVRAEHAYHAAHLAALKQVAGS